MLAGDERRLVIDIDDIRSFDSHLANEYGWFCVLIF